MSHFNRSLVLGSLVFTSCVGGADPTSRNADPQAQNTACTSIHQAPIPTGSTGEANVYLVDPATAAGDATLSPGSESLGNYTTRVTLERLLGQGTLSGAYVNVVSGSCSQRAGAYDPQNRFLYAYGDGRLAEAMDYYHGDRFRARLDQADALLPAEPVKIIANCEIQDNAYYTQDLDGNGNLVDRVCMGTSSRFAQGNLSHDAQVVLHELQHSTTAHAYSPTLDFNRFYYDDAGSINEGISDFMAMMSTEEFIPASVDGGIFSRWALGALLPNQARGIARCPVYDSGYPNCAHFSLGSEGFSAEQNHISFSYPDGLGWPMARNRPGPAFVKNHFTANSAIEEIHQNGVIASGVLWDAYLNLKALMPEDIAQSKMLKLVVETTASLPKPNAATDLSPVTYPMFGAKLLETAGLLGWTAGERSALQLATDQRGLTNAPQLPASWASVGSGKLRTPGMHILDSSSTGGQSNGKLNRGDFAAIFYDIRNDAAVTAGSVLLDVTIPGESIVFLDRSDNEGYVNDSHAMIRYGKINGTAIVAALSSGNSTYHVPTSNHYFKTNPQYASASGMTTPLYVFVPESAATGPASFSVRVQPANGPAVTLSFPVEIHP